MKILAIETSCDESAVALLECVGDERSASFKVLGNALLSQIDIHKEYGGVYPAIAKREHAKNLVPLLVAALEESELAHEHTIELLYETRKDVAQILEREPELAEALFAFIPTIERPAIDAIAVTHGPGLEPALWVGVNFARALARAWDIPVVGVNHMEGHLLSALADGDERSSTIAMPERLLALLISGGHTQIILRTSDGYKLIGETRDDAVGEAYDKVARMLDLPYPGGPEISKLAERARDAGRTSDEKLPRPMLDTNDFDFSFSGLKTAVLYRVKELGILSDEQKESLALAFENAAGDVLLKKTLRALDETAADALAIGGGVSANTHIRRLFTDTLLNTDTKLFIPPRALTGDNAIMIGIAGYYHALRKEFADPATLRADGNLSLA